MIIKYLLCLSKVLELLNIYVTMNNIRKINIFIICRAVYPDHFQSHKKKHKVTFTFISLNDKRRTDDN